LGVRLRVRLDSQLTQIIQAVGTMQQNMATKQDLAAVEQKVSGIEQKLSAVEQNINAAREDIISLRHKTDSIEGGVSVVIRNTFTAYQRNVDDLNVDLVNNERKTRRLNRRVERLERQDLDD
jgi:predicted RNase H-like nuclease (RuvC/YqgF family)